MSALDMPTIPPQYTPVVIATSTQAEKENGGADRIIGICHLAENPTDRPPSIVNFIEPISQVWAYLQKYEGRTVDIRVDLETAKVSVLQAPEHGTLKGEGNRDYRYVPWSDYTGTDRATLLVGIGGLKVKVVYFFRVLNHVVPGSEEYDPYEDKKNCPNGYQWRISSRF